MMNMTEIEFWEQEYLKQIYFLLMLEKEKMFEGFNTKEYIRSDWIDFLGKETSDFARGSERIFYWLFNQFGQPNSSPIGSDLFFETYNAYIHIDIKTVTTDNIGDYTNTIFVGNNQTSYQSTFITTTGRTERYKPHLPPFYNKKVEDYIEEKICLTYLITILYDKKDLDILNIALMCIPNGNLKEIYNNDVFVAGKNPGKVRFNFKYCNKFRTISNGDNSRIKIIFQKDFKFLNKEIIKRLKFWIDLYNKQKHEKLRSHG